MQTITATPIFVPEAERAEDDGDAEVPHVPEAAHGTPEPAVNARESIEVCEILTRLTRCRPRLRCCKLQVSQVTIQRRPVFRDSALVYPSVKD